MISGGNEKRRRGRGRKGEMPRRYPGSTCKRV